MSETHIIWRGIDRPGHEHVLVRELDPGWRLDGVAVFMEGATPCRLDYAIRCDHQWHTHQVAVTGWVGDSAIRKDILVTPDQRWFLDGVECQAVRGCLDIDLNFSPATNLLPIRRCAPQVGEVTAVRAAWLRFPSFVLEPLEQTYERLADETYRYSSGGGAFTAELKVNGFGLVVAYPGGWVAE